MGRLPAVPWTASFAEADLSFQQPIVVLASAPVQVDEATSVLVSAPSSHRLSVLPDIRPAGYGVTEALPEEAPVPAALVAVTVTE